MAACHQIMHENGLTGTTLRALRFLPLTGSLPMRELASRMGCDNSYVTSLVDTLEQLGLAGRVHQAYATPPAAFAALSDTEVTTLCDLLRKLDPAGPDAQAQLSRLRRQESALWRVLARSSSARFAGR